MPQFRLFSATLEHALGIASNRAVVNMYSSRVHIIHQTLGIGFAQSIRTMSLFDPRIPEIGKELAFRKILEVKVIVLDRGWRLKAPSRAEGTKPSRDQLSFALLSLWSGRESRSRLNNNAALATNTYIRLPLTYALRLLKSFLVFLLRTFWYVLSPYYCSNPLDDKLNSALLRSRRTYPLRDSWNFYGLHLGEIYHR
ncbi:hypothetical protein M9H77_07117 [Catharanthus roseus]|uniref:Uncharacterized protein n=1 Tax=Catharanthus roseus TaxID=4058 RepID=A0ACC0BU98_CATRO|nr:hypothetical protein M9H77_07117 [Catharanthus roseus]